VQQPVRADDLLLRPWRPAVERGHKAAGLLQDRHERRVVPRREPRIHGCIDRPFGDEGVLPEIAEGTGVPDGRLDSHEVAPVRRRHRGVSETRNRRDPDCLPVPKRALATCRPPAVAERRSRDDAADDLVLSLERDQRRPDRNAAREVLRPVDRIDHPPDRTDAGAFLLAHDALARTAGRDALPQCALDHTIRVRHGRRVRLGVDAEVDSAEPPQAQRVGEVGKLEGESEVGGRHPPRLLRPGLGSAKRGERRPLAKPYAALRPG
jgi:hypothetical protein